MSLLKGFQLFDDTVGVFGIVFSYPCFDTRGVKEKDSCFILMNLLSYRFGQINKMAEHGL